MSRPAPRSLLGRVRIEALLFALMVIIVGPIVHDNGAQQASRLSLTAAVWERGTFSLDDYEQALGIDRAVKDGRVYSDKAPLQPILAVPFYAIYTTVGGESAVILRVEENLGLWWVTFWSSAVPLGLLTVLMYRFVRRYHRDAVAASLSVACGTMLLPFGSLLFGHVLTALLLFAAFFLVMLDRPERWHLVSAGAAAGAAVAVEYTALLGLGVIAVAVVVRWRREVGWYLLGCAPFGVLLGAYHAVVFGSPLAYPYRYSAFEGVVDEARSLTGVFGGLHPERLWQVFFAGRGFAVASPIVLLGLYGCVVLARSRSVDHRVIGGAGVAMFLVYLGVMVWWDTPWGGNSPGPRYMVPAIPFVVVGVAAVWDRFRLLRLAAVAAGVVTMGLATFTNPLISRSVAGGLGDWVHYAANAEFTPTLFTMALGPAGWLVHAAAAIVVAVALRRSAAAGSSA